MVTTAATARARLEVRPTTDRALLRAFLEQDRLFAAYAICDLDDREFQRTRWGVAISDGEPVAIALEYGGLTPQPLFVMGTNEGIAGPHTSRPARRRSRPSLARTGSTLAGR
jgi:hypothetical protein